MLILQLSHINSQTSPFGAFVESQWITRYDDHTARDSTRYTLENVFKINRLGILQIGTLRADLNIARHIKFIYKNTFNISRWQSNDIHLSGNTNKYPTVQTA